MEQHQGPITLMENLPFVIHRFLRDCWHTSGLILLESPLFYVVLILLLHVCLNASTFLSTTLVHFLDMFEDFGILVFVLISLGGHLVNYCRQQRERM